MIELIYINIISFLDNGAMMRVEKQYRQLEGIDEIRIFNSSQKDLKSLTLRISLFRNFLTIFRLKFIVWFLMKMVRISLSKALEILLSKNITALLMTLKADY